MMVKKQAEKHTPKGKHLGDEPLLILSSMELLTVSTLIINHQLPLNAKKNSSFRAYGLGSGSISFLDSSFA